MARAVRVCVLVGTLVEGDGARRGPGELATVGADEVAGLVALGLVRELTEAEAKASAAARPRRPRQAQAEMPAAGAELEGEIEAGAATVQGAELEASAAAELEAEAGAGELLELQPGDESGDVLAGG